LIKGRKSRPSMVGLRFFFLQPHQQNWLTDGMMDWLWPAAERAQIPIALMASNHLPAVGRIAKRHPSLRLLIDHFARVRGTTDDAAHSNQPALLVLAKYPNVAVKATGRQATRAGPIPIATSTAISSRSMACSARSGCSGVPTSPARRARGGQCVTMFTEELPWLEGRDLELVMRRAVCDWIGWTLSG
jgi:Amidohydrolase